MNNDELKNKMVKVLRELRASKPIVTNDFGKWVFTDKSKAESRLAELKGEKK